MRNGFYDKLFFIDKLFDDWHTFMDYGCGEGFVTQMIGKIFPGKIITGYEENENMLKIDKYANEVCDNVSFTSHLSGQEFDIVCLSSVIHEVYSYNEVKTIDAFWDYIYSTTKKYIIIRDMTHHSMQVFTQVSDERQSRLRDHTQAIGAKYDLEKFELRFGTIGNARNFVHWLLKYTYHTSPNWHRELHENYLPVSVEDLISKAPNNWSVFYKNLYQLPYFTHLWAKDLGITVPYNTHCNIILKRNS
jgi:hypothetical protein